MFSTEELAIWSRVMSDDAPTLQRGAAVNRVANVSQASNTQLACQAEGLGVRPVSGRNSPGISTSAYALETGVPGVPVGVGPGSYVNHDVAAQQGSYEHIPPVEVAWHNAEDATGAEVRRVLNAPQMRERMLRVELEAKALSQEILNQDRVLMAGGHRGIDVPFHLHFLIKETCICPTLWPPGLSKRSYSQLYGDSSPSTSTTNLRRVTKACTYGHRPSFSSKLSFFSKEFMLWQVTAPRGR